MTGEIADAGSVSKWWRRHVIMEKCVLHTGHVPLCFAMVCYETKDNEVGWQVLWGKLWRATEYVFRRYFDQARQYFISVIFIWCCITLYIALFTAAYTVRGTNPRCCNQCVDVEISGVWPTRKRLPGDDTALPASAIIGINSLSADKCWRSHRCFQMMGPVVRFTFTWDRLIFIMGLYCQGDILYWIAPQVWVLHMWGTVFCQQMQRHYQAAFQMHR